MEYNRKRRVVGILVLLALAVIVYPLFFSRSADKEEQVVIIPEPPPEAVVPRYVEVVDTPVQVPEPPAEFQPPPTVKDNDRPVLDDNGLPISWTLQLAAFSEQKNALQLQDRLRKDKYQAYIRKGTDTAQNAVYRVYVGPELRRGKIVQMKSRLASGYKLDGIIVRYRP